MSVNNKNYYHRLPLMHVPFWNWEDNTKDSSEVDKIRPKYFEWPTNHFRESLYTIVIENSEKMRWYVHNKDMIDKSFQHIENI